MIDDAFHNTVNMLANHGKGQFIPAFELYLQPEQCQFYHRHPLAEPFRIYLATLGSTLVLTVLVSKLLRSFKNSPLLVDFTQYLYETLIRFGTSVSTLLVKPWEMRLWCVFTTYYFIYGMYCLC
jgi:hypothetical protein